jgi:predicted nucleic acid-binding protein
MLIPNVFLDTNIIVDFIVPSERAKYACSVKLIEKIGKGDFKAWSADYALSETLGKLKQNREESIGVKDVPRETLSTYEIEQMTKIIEEFKKTPNFEVFEVEPIRQMEVFDKVKTICVQATDALVILSVLSLKKKLGDITLVTRDGKLLMRGKRLIKTAHPIELVGTCPLDCGSRFTCKHYSRYKSPSS